MAANNYFGFTPGGTQYSAHAATAYPTAQTAYVQPAQPAAYATAAPRAAQTYDTYQTTQTTGQYAYVARPQGVAPPPPPASQQAYTTDTYFARTTQAATGYETGKAYYQPAQAAYTVAAAPETHYQAPGKQFPAGTGQLMAVNITVAKPVYSTTTYNTAPAARQTATQKTPTTSVSSASYVYPSTTSTATPSTSYATTSSSTTYSGSDTSTNFPGYDAALYSAATTYYQQQQAAKTGGSTWTAGYKKTNQQKPKQKAPPKQPQLHYCDVCKISCAGPQTYREHLEGQKHKKKEAALKSGGTNAPAGRGGQNQLRCELCDVSCTGSDAYAAHIRGAKHQKVLKLHTKLGKPIPSTEPVIVSANTTTTATTAGKTTATTTQSSTKATAIKTTSSAPAATKKVVATPKITFVGGTQLKTTGAKTEEIKSVKVEADSNLSDSNSDKDSDGKVLLPGEKDVQPVGHEYIEEVKNETGKTVSFNCKLCECKFNDPNAKEMHMKGRRHRLQYKKKVDPSLQVEVKPSIRARKIQEEKARRQAQKEEYWRRRDLEERWREEMRMEEVYWEERRRYEEEMEYYEWQRRQGGRGVPPHPPFPPQPPMQMRRPDSSDDRHVMAKHTSIYPNEQELQAVQNIVSSCEKALKLVSDFIAESDAPKPMETTEAKKETKKVVPVPEVKEEEKEGDKKEENQLLLFANRDQKEENQPAPRALKGVMRVGVLAKGLLLHGDTNVQLVVLCSEKPTRTLLERVADSLPKQLATVTEDKYEVKRCVEEAALIVTAEKDPKMSCTITLTSPIMRDENLPDGAQKAGETVKDPPDVLDRHKCLEALAALRHAKWFQARANGLQSCVVVIRILRDLCQRVPTWTPLNQWAMELLVEKCVSSGGSNMSPGDALRRVFECIASGILLPGGPGLYDPCEKDPADAAGTLTNQEREDITASAQHALRLIAFRQIHKVLGMDQLPTPRFQQKRFNPRKRRRTNSAGEGGDSEGGEGKKDKKEDGDSMETGNTDTTQIS